MMIAALVEIFCWCGLHIGVCYNATVGICPLMKCQSEDSIEWKVDLKSDLHMREELKVYVDVDNTTNLLYSVSGYKREKIYYEMNIY